MDNNQQVTPDASTSNPTPSAPSSATNSSSKRHPQNLPLIIIIGVLILIIIGIIIAIFIVNQNKSSQSLDDSDSNIASVYHSAFEIKKPIDDAFLENGNVDNLISSYQTAIDSATSSKNYDLSVTLINYLAMKLVSINYCNDAISILTSIDPSSFDAESQGKFYLNSIGTSIDCNEQELYQKWNAAYSNLNIGESNE